MSSEVSEVQVPQLLAHLSEEDLAKTRKHNDEQEEAELGEKFRELNTEAESFIRTKNLRRDYCTFATWANLQWDLAQLQWYMRECSHMISTHGLGATVDMSKTMVQWESLYEQLDTDIKRLGPHMLKQFGFGSWADVDLDTSPHCLIARSCFAYLHFLLVDATATVRSECGFSGPLPERNICKWVGGSVTDEEKRAMSKWRSRIWADGSVIRRSSWFASWQWYIYKISLCTGNIGHPRDDSIKIPENRVGHWWYNPLVPDAERNERAMRRVEGLATRLPCNGMKIHRDARAQFLVDSGHSAHFLNER